ncbi:MAG TPA: hypothetical protein PLD62_03670 [Candidatus Cloacimonadota bacterium]|nr:hypothetical protein [Candidatus Cloacimonadota bacterium]
MKQIKCRNCGQIVSSNAKRCKKCGTLLRLPLTGVIFIIAVVLFIVAVFLIGYFQSI